MTNEYDIFRERFLIFAEQNDEIDYNKLLEIFYDVKYENPEDDIVSCLRSGTLPKWYFFHEMIYLLKTNKMNRIIYDAYHLCIKYNDDLPHFLNMMHEIIGQSNVEGLPRRKLFFYDGILWKIIGETSERFRCVRVDCVYWEMNIFCEDKIVKLIFRLYDLNDDSIKRTFKKRSFNIIETSDDYFTTRYAFTWEH